VKRCETLVSVAVEKFINALSQLYRYSDVSLNLLSLCTLRGVSTPSGAGGRELLHFFSLPLAFNYRFNYSFAISRCLKREGEREKEKERERERERERETSEI